MVTGATKSSPSSLSEVLFHRHNTSVLQLTPTLFYRFGEKVIRRVLGVESHVRVLAFGGEVCPSVERLSAWKSAEVCVSRNQL
jgi:acyl-CoA synthetase